jgi:hypothetical protein
MPIVLSCQLKEADQGLECQLFSLDLLVLPEILEHFKIKIKWVFSTALFKRI